jgi:hypothetical protein
MNAQPPSAVQEGLGASLVLALGDEEEGDAVGGVAVASGDWVGGVGTAEGEASCGVAAGWASAVVWRGVRWARWFVGVRSWFGCCEGWDARGSAMARKLPAISVRMRDFENCILEFLGLGS